MQPGKLRATFCVCVTSAAPLRQPTAVFPAEHTVVFPTETLHSFAAATARAVGLHRRLMHPNGAHRCPQNLQANTFRFSRRGGPSCTHGCFRSSTHRCFPTGTHNGVPDDTGRHPPNCTHSCTHGPLFNAAARAMCFGGIYRHFSIGARLLVRRHSPLSAPLVKRVCIRSSARCWLCWGCSVHARCCIPSGLLRTAMSIAAHTPVFCPRGDSPLPDPHTHRLRHKPLLPTRQKVLFPNTAQNCFRSVTL